MKVLGLSIWNMLPTMKPLEKVLAQGIVEVLVIASHCRKPENWIERF